MPPRPATAPAVPEPAEPDPRLASDLGHALDTLLEHTGGDVLAIVDEHGLTPAEARLLVGLDRRPVGPRAEESLRTGVLDPDIAARALGRLRERALVTTGARGPRLTAEGRALARRLERARRAELGAFVARLDRAGRRRLAAAIELLVGAPASGSAPASG